ncbi:unnamed protein product [Caenorhabditis brenneri]
MSEPEEKTKIQLQPTFGVEDYASQYKERILNEQLSVEKIIESAKYFVQMRKDHLTEILNNWDQLDEEIDLDLASTILNEFLSPKCTLLEFEFKNLTKTGREQKVKMEEPINEENFHEVWQRHILGQVLPSQSHDISINVPVNNDNQIKSKIQETLIEDSDDSYCNDVEDTAVEVFTLYKRVRWFITTVKTETLGLSRFAKADLKKSIESFNQSFSSTWKAITVLVYLDIIETMRDDPMKIVGVVFAKLSTLMLEEKRDGVLSNQSTDLLKVADMFISRYRPDWTDDDKFRCGLAYLSIKLQLMKVRPDGGDPNVLSVCSLLSDEEVQVTQVYDVMKQHNDFSECEI